MTLGAFFAILTSGVLSGLVYEAGKVLRLFCGNKLTPTVVIDFIVALCSGGLFIAAEFVFCDFALSGYAFLAFFAGLFLERTTIGFLLAKYIESVYNWLSKLKNRLKATKIGGRFFK